MFDVIPESADWAAPHPKVFTQFESWVLWKDGCDPDGTFIGHCPLHDESRSIEASAEFNFAKGFMRCAGECHPGKRAMSISNLTARMNDVSND